jgi:hypothetical protein
MIRTDIAQFTLLWNSHSIRPQPNRPHVNPGIPQDLYNTDEIRNWGVPIAEGSAEEQVLRTMYEPLQEIEIDEFMDQECVCVFLFIARLSRRLASRGA